MRYVLLFSMILLFFSGCAEKHPAPLMHQAACESGIYSVKSAQCLEHETLIERLAPYPVIFLGDHHSSKEVHDFGADLIRGLHKAGYTVHLANEWFTPKDDDLLAQYAAKKFDDGNFTKKTGWKKRMSYDFSLFAPMYHAVQESEGFLYGINLSKEERKRISKEALSDMSEEERTFFESLDTNVSAHRQMLSPFFGHCHSPKKGESAARCSERMYRVQVAWDTKMGHQSALLAERVLTGPEDKLIVFIGSMHLYEGLGANLRYARLCNIPSITILPEVASKPGYEHGTADYFYIYTPEKKEKK